MLKSEKIIYWVMIIINVVICVGLIYHFATFELISKDDEIVKSSKTLFSEYRHITWVRLEMVVTVMGINVMNAFYVKNRIKSGGEYGRLFSQLYWGSLGFSILALCDISKLLIFFFRLFPLLIRMNYTFEAVAMLISLVIPIILILSWCIWTIAILRNRFKSNNTFKM